MHRVPYLPLSTMLECALVPSLGKLFGLSEKDKREYKGKKEKACHEKRTATFR